MLLFTTGILIAIGAHLAGHALGRLSWRRRWWR